MYVSAKLGDEVSGMLQTILRKDSSKFRNKKELVLEEALGFTTRTESKNDGARSRDQSITTTSTNKPPLTNRQSSAKMQNNAINHDAKSSIWLWTF